MSKPQLARSKRDYDHLRRRTTLGPQQPTSRKQAEKAAHLQGGHILQLQIWPSKITEKEEPGDTMDG